MTIEIRNLKLLLLAECYRKSKSILLNSTRRTLLTSPAPIKCRQVQFLLLWALWPKEGSEKKSTLDE